MSEPNPRAGPGQPRAGASRHPPASAATGHAGAADESFPQVPPAPPERSAVGARSGRLHPAVMAIWPLSQAGPVVVFLVAGVLSLPLALAVLLLSALASVVRYLRFSWRIEEDALVVEQGLLQRQRRVIPLERIQSVDLSRSLRHRVFGVVEVRVEAIGGASTEGRLDALDKTLASQLQRVLLRERDRAAGTAESPPATPAEAADAEHHEPTPSEPVLVRLAPARLVAAGLTGGRVGVVAALLGFLQQVFADRLEELLPRLPQVLGLRGLLAVVVIAVVGAFILSVAATVVVYWDFTLTRQGGTLRIRRGLLEQRLETLPLRRIQALRVEENLLRRLLGVATVKADIAGRAGNEGRDTGLLLPLGTRAAAFALVERILEEPGLADVPLSPMPTRARTRRLFRAGLSAAAATGAALVVTWPTGLWALGALVVFVPAAQSAYRALGHAESDGYVLARAGLLVRRTAFVPHHRLQSLALTATPVQRWRNLATLELQIARSPGVWPGPRLIDLDAGEATALQARLAAVMANGRARRRATEASSPLAV